MALKTAHNPQSDLSWINNSEVRAALNGRKVLKFPERIPDQKQATAIVSKHLTLGVTKIKVPQFDGTDPAFAIVSASRQLRRDYPNQPVGDMAWRELGAIREAKVGYKLCNTCGDERSLDKFAVDKRNRDGLDNRCKGCEADRQRRWRATARAA